MTVSDKKIGIDNNSDGTIDSYLPDVVTANDYYPFGMMIPGRKFSAGTGYRYGFNGKENDNDVKGEGNQQDYGMRVYDPRIGKFLSVDPITKNYPSLTPYQFASNSPIKCIDLDGLEGDPIKSIEFWLDGVFDDLTSGERWVQGMRNVNENFNPLYIAANHVSKITVKRDLDGNPINGDRVNAVAEAGVDVMAWITFGKLFKTVSAYGTNAMEAELNSSKKLLEPNSKPPIETNKPVLNNTSAEVTASTGNRAKALIVNKSNSLTSEAIVKERLTSQLSVDEAILEKPRIYIGDGSSGKYAQPDFAVYNTKTGQFVKLVDAKDGGAGLTKAQQQVNEYGGTFRGSSRAPDVLPQKIAANPNAIQIERTNVTQEVINH